MIMQPSWQLDLGARVLGKSGARFRVWAPFAQHVSLKLCGARGSTTAMSSNGLGYFSVEMQDVHPGDRYVYVLDGQKERPDPASRSQPDGVHGSSAVVDPAAFHWSDARWQGRPLQDMVIYELHVGCFGRQSTFTDIIERLNYLRDLGVTAVELMPVAQFPGSRNWGYDGVFLFAPQSTYGGPQGLKPLVDACHQCELAVVLDVVYNHLGPEGNYLGDFGPYFTDRYRTPWGQAINYDGPDSDAVRHYIVSNALYWITEYHIDALRLDAIHGIYDFSARHILRELADAVHAQAADLGRTVSLIAESDLNDVRVIASPTEGGHGLDAQWSDDFHHALHTVLTGERAGYYEDFGSLEQLATALQDGFVYSGQRTPHRRRRHGSSSRGRPPYQLVVYAQNHDQVGNRAFGDRLSTLVPWDALKVSAAMVLLAPHTPMLFMGEEFGETAPFQYFVDHSDAALIEAVRQGRRKEFEAFGWTEVPDPQDAGTFERSRVRPDMPLDERQQALLRWYRQLIHLRQHVSMLRSSVVASQHRAICLPDQHVLLLERWTDDANRALLIVNVHQTAVALHLSEPKGRWGLQTTSWKKEFGGNDTPVLSDTLEIGATGTPLTLPAHGVALYMTPRGEHAG